jgi:5S rRNA maturation endonuclease (ribonuclease M5)
MRFFGVGDSLLKYGISRLRSIIPIHNDDGSIVISNLYRSTVDWLEPKFLIEKNFKKGDYLYNYHRASNVAKQSNTIFLVEGSGDVWRMYEAGVLNCVSIMGKDISLNQRIKLDKLCVLNIVVLLDSDESGRESKVNLMRDLSRFYNLIFPRFSYKKDIGKMNPIDIKNNILFNLKGKY